MAYEPTSESGKTQIFDLTDLSIETIYANTTHVVVGEGDVSIYLGYHPVDGNNVPASNVKRVVLTHDSFMRMMEFWASRYRLLETLYGGKPKTLRDLDAETIKAAFDTMLGNPGESVSENATGNIPGNETNSSRSASDT